MTSITAESQIQTMSSPRYAIIFSFTFDTLTTVMKLSIDIFASRAPSAGLVRHLDHFDHQRVDVPVHHAHPHM